MPPSTPASAPAPEAKKELSARDQLIAEKVAAGLSRPMAEEVADAQLAHDAALAAAEKAEKPSKK